MASELIVQTIQGPSSGANANKVLIPSGHTLDASAGFIPPSGSVVRMGSEKHSTYASTSSVNAWTECYSFSISGITSGNQVYIQYSVCDLVEHANRETFRIRRGSDQATLVQWARQTNANGGWRGIIADATCFDDDTTGGTRTYYLDFANSTSGTIYVNYTGGDAASFLTWWEIAG